MSLARLWDMYEDEAKLWLRKNVVNAEENCKMLGPKEQMEKYLSFFKLDFAKMVAEKEQAIAQLGSTQLALSDLKQELEKKKLSDKSTTSIHRVVSAKAEKERDQMMQERDKLMEEREQLKKEKKKLDYMIGDLFKHKEDTKCKIMKVREMLDEIE
ncbi:hypothetical protein CFC21_075905 [Triticum aestivum]|uniref:Uncharacterized protein n=2 Tax=Triticum aestivum TaxID=4565 RepID=A0A9R1HQZ5_WHEAT|nr:hypothetical protein CFC21_075905 [Triticum aestivum]